MLYQLKNVLVVVNIKYSVSVFNNFYKAWDFSKIEIKFYNNKS